MKEPTCYARSSSFDNQFKKAFELSNTYEAVDPHGEWQLKKAIFSILSGDLAESENRLEALKKAPSNHTIAITVAHESRLFLALVRVILHGQQANFHDLYSILSQELKNVPPVTLPTPLLGLRVSQKQIEGERIFYQFLENSQSSGSSENSSFSRISSLLGNSPVLTWIGLRHYLTQGKASDAVSPLPRSRINAPIGKSRRPRRKLLQIAFVPYRNSESL